MPGTDPLHRLIQSMTKAEKRQFKLGSRTDREAGSENALFVQLFDVLDKIDEYDEEIVFRKAPGIKRTQLPNLKRHLYRQLLTTLRPLHNSKNMDMQIREQLDFAKVLYNKGLCLQSLKVLEKAGEMARTAKLNLLLLEILEFEKMIELRHITRSMDNRAEVLNENADRAAQMVQVGERLSGLALQLYGIYIKTGHVKSEQDAFMLNAFFRSNLPETDFQALDFWEKMFYCKSYMWYYYILQNFVNYYKYAQKWVDLYEAEPEMRHQDPDLYLRALHNLLISFFFTAQYDRFCATLKQLDAYIEAEQDAFSMNTHVQAFIYQYTAKINRHFMEGSFTAGLPLADEVEKRIVEYGDYLDRHRILVLYYKIACLYFGNGNMDRAIDYLNKIIHFNAGNLREDIQCYARILHLIAHYELKHYDLLEYLVLSVYRFLAKMEDLNAVQKEIIKFLRQELHSNPENLMRAFRQLHARLLKLRELPYERRSFLYLDIIAWLESKMKGHHRTEEVIAARFMLRER
jgi:tetratricopeptide (TPR) repeat protein